MIVRTKNTKDRAELSFFHSGKEMRLTIVKIINPHDKLDPFRLEGTLVEGARENVVHISYIPSLLTNEFLIKLYSSTYYKIFPFQPFLCEIDHKVILQKIIKFSNFEELESFCIGE